MDEKLLNAVKKAIIDNAEQSNFNRVHDCIVDVLDIKPTNEQVKEVVLLLPSEIIGEAVKWGLSDTVVGDNTYEWLEENKSTVIKNIFKKLAKTGEIKCK